MDTPVHMFISFREEFSYSMVRECHQYWLPWTCLFYILTGTSPRHVNLKDLFVPSGSLEMQQLQFLNQSVRDFDKTRRLRHSITQDKSEPLLGQLRHQVRREQLTSGLVFFPISPPPPQSTLRGFIYHPPSCNSSVQQACDFSGFFLISGFLYKSPFASKCSWKKRSSHQGKKEVACIVSKPLVSCLWRCGESTNRPKIKHP